MSITIHADHEHERSRVRRRPDTSTAGAVHDTSATALLRSLQRSVGNQAVNQILRQYRLQREAMPDEEDLQAKHLVQRAEAEQDEVEEEELQAKHLMQRAEAEQEGVEEEELQAKHLMQREAMPDEEDLQAKPEVGLEGGPVSGEIASRIQSRRGGGDALDGTSRTQMEDAFGTSFSDVRVHHDSESTQLNRSVSAVAFTTGNDIFFQQGTYNPGSSEGRGLLAHELTHVVQQRSMGGSGGMAVRPAGDQYEQEADAVSAAVSRHIDEGSKAV